MDSTVLVLNAVLSTCTAFIYCAGLCSAMKMKANAGFTASIIFVDALTCVLKYSGADLALLALVNFFCKAVLLPLLFSSERPLATVIKSCTAFVLFYIMGIVMTLLMFVIWPGVEPDVINELVTPLQLTLIYLLCWGVYGVLAYLHAQVCRKISRGETNLTLVPFAGFLLTELIVAPLSLQVLTANPNVEGAVAYQLVLLAHSILYAALCACILWRHEAFLKAQGKLAAQALLAKQLRAVQKGYQDSTTAQERLRKIRHDLANHLQVIGLLANSGTKEEAREYLARVSASLDDSPMPAYESPIEIQELQGETNERLEPEDSAPQSLGAAPRAVLAVLIVASQIIMLAVAYARATAYGVDWLSAPVVGLVGVLCALIDAALLWSIAYQEKRTAKAQYAVSEMAMRQAIDSFGAFTRAQDALATALENEARQTIKNATEHFDDINREALESTLSEGIEKADAASACLCENAVANAVVRMEMQNCQAAGIAFSYDLNLHPELSLSPVHLASLLFNLLDNAQAGCASSGKDEPRVSIDAYCRNDNLVVVVKNSCDPKLKGVVSPKSRSHRRSAEHGWGLSIVDEIAKENEGIALFEAADGMFTAQITICLR